MRLYAFALDLALTLAVALPPFGGPASGDDAVSPSPQTQAQAALPDAAPPPPPKSNPEPSAPQPITLRIAATPAPAPAPSPKPQPQTFTLHLVSAPQAAADTAPAPTPAPIPVTLTVQPQQPAPAAAVVPVPSAPATVAARVHYPGPLRVAIGNLGEALARQKMARIFVPLADAQVQPAQAAAVRLAPLAIRQADPLPAVQYVEAQPVLASPQSPGFCKNLFRRR